MASITLDSMLPAIQSARAGNYEQLRQYFRQDYKEASIYLAKSAVEAPHIFDIRRDSSPRGFLEKMADNIAGGHPEPQTLKEHLARTLAFVVPKTPLGVSEHTLFIGISVLATFLYPFDEGKTFQIAEKATHRLFGQYREKKYRELFHLAPLNLIHHRKGTRELPPFSTYVGAAFLIAIESMSHPLTNSQIEISQEDNATVYKISRTL